MPNVTTYKIKEVIILVLASIVSLIVYRFTDFSFQLIAILVVLYLGGELVVNHSKLIEYKKEFDTFFLVSICLSIVFATGGPLSPLFFLLYFLLFGVSLLMEPKSSLVLVLLISIFLAVSPKQDVLHEYLQIASLFLVVPLAHIFGTQYKKLLQDEDKIKILTNAGKQIEARLAKNEEEVKKWSKNDFTKRLFGMWQDLNKLSLTNKNQKDLELIKKIKSEVKGLQESANELEDKFLK